MYIIVVGVSFVGLVTAACMAEFGFEVIVWDDDKRLISDLNSNKINIYEPGLDQIIAKLHNKSLFFTNNIKDIKDKMDVVIFALSTPYTKDGDQDLSKFMKVIDQFCEGLNNNRHTTFVLKTTMPIGTSNIVEQRVEFHRPDLIPHKHYDVVLNPCFLREGSAIHDFIMPDRIIIGLDKNAKIARSVMENIYDRLLKTNIPIVFTSFEEAEIIKSASNSFLATKIAFINEIADLCEKTGANIDNVVRGIGMDPKISYHCLEVGPGYNSYAFDRDTRVLVKSALNLGCDLSIINAAIKSNDNRKLRIVNRVNEAFSDLDGIAGKKICVLGITTKPETNEIKNSTSLVLIEELEKIGAKIVAYDPIYSELNNCKKKMPDKVKKINISDSIYNAVKECDAIVIATGWPEFRTMDLSKIAQLVKTNNHKPIIIDFWNLFKEEDMQLFRYISVGRNILLSR